MRHSCCPVCGSYKIVDAKPLINKHNGKVFARRLSCDSCNYTDRTENFKGCLSLNGINTVNADFRFEGEPRA